MASSKPFNPYKDIPDLKGKVVLVTGGNSGIGYATIRILLKHGAKVYMGARSEAKAKKAIEKLTAEGLGSSAVHYVNVDLSDPVKAKADAEAFLRIENRLDILINNAAQIPSPFNMTKFGIQDVVVIDYLSQVAFTHAILPLLEQTAKESGSDVRIVNVSSVSPSTVPPGARFRNRDDFNHEFPKERLPDLSRYGLAKLAFAIWAKELQRRLTAKGLPIQVLSADPGSTRTEGLLKYADNRPFVLKYIIVLLTYTYNTAEKGAYPSLFAAGAHVVREQEDTYRGAFILPGGKLGKPPNKDIDNEELAKELWATTETLLTEIGAWKDIQ